MNINKYQKIFGVGPIGLLISFVLLVVFWLVDRGLGHVKILSQPALSTAAGLSLLVIWIGWHASAIRTIRTWWDRDRLCTSGPYRFVRHPMYAGAVFLVAPAVALLFNSWVIFLWPVFLYPVWSFLVRHEEKMMLAFFGDDYRRYAARTGRLFPRVVRLDRIAGN